MTYLVLLPRSSYRFFTTADWSHIQIYINFRNNPATFLSLVPRGGSKVKVIIYSAFFSKKRWLACLPPVSLCACGKCEWTFIIWVRILLIMQTIYRHSQGVLWFLLLCVEDGRKHVRTNTSREGWGCWYGGGLWVGGNSWGSLLNCAIGYSKK